ncbi:MAG: hypothetical protein LBQ12_15410 [Deltaproteobacteria bacterium]|jgi:hypothetical protein|nr:hypothetical protein [Deltaproteobacteria bacterium]
MKARPGWKPYKIVYPGPHLIQTSGPPGSSFVIRNIPLVPPIAEDSKKISPPGKDGVAVRDPDSGTDGGRPGGAGD